MFRSGLNYRSTSASNYNPESHNPRGGVTIMIYLRHNEIRARKGKLYKISLLLYNYII